MDYETINDKIVTEIKENYLKCFYKEVKKIKIIMVGYNVGQQKDLRVLKEYGWEIMTGMHDEDWLYYRVTTRPTSKMKIEFYLKKRMNDDTLEYEYVHFGHHFSKVIINISIDKTDEIYKIINQIEKLECSNSVFCLENDSLKIAIDHMIDGEYILTISD